MSKQLIINSDDFGMSKEVNEGTKIGILKGIVKSVSVMPNMPFFNDAIIFLKKHPHVSVGLHFNITEGKPLISPHVANNLIREDDNFHFWISLIPRLMFRNIKLCEIEEELKAQYSKLEATGLRITHIDSHHHVHLYPRIFKLISKFSDKKNVLSLRGDYFSYWNITLGINNRPIPTQVVVNTMLLYSHLRYPRRKRFNEIRRFYDVNWGKKMSIEDFMSILHNLPDGITELICHLAIESEKGNKKFLSPRYKTLQLLTHPQLKKHFHQNGIDLSSHTSFYRNN